MAKVIKESADRREEVVVEQVGNTQYREHRVRDVAAERQQILYKIIQFIWLIVGVLEGLIGLRVILKLIAANPESPFASLVYNFTWLFLWPFLGLTATPSAGNVVLEIPSIIAMIVYALVAWVFVSLVRLIFERYSTRSVSVYEER